MNTDHKILLTGATGAIGMEFLRQMKSHGKLKNIAILARNSTKNVKKLKEFNELGSIFWGDLNNPEIVASAVTDKTVVIHLAALIPTVESENEALVTKVNVEGTRNLVNAMEVHAPDAQLLFSSSVAIYGDRINSPNITINDPKLGVEYDHYSRTKVAAEEIIVSSNLNWSIYRLSAIMGIGNHKISAIMFHVPLNTPMEITTVRDTANAFVQSLNKREHINHNIFNLGGGEQCRISYNDFMTRAFEAFGMGPVHFPEYAFAHQNFHCGYYADGDELEEILKFRSDTLDTYFERFRKSVNPLQRIATRPFAGIVKWFLARLSEPLKAYKNGDQERIEFFFGDLKS